MAPKEQHLGFLELPEQEWLPRRKGRCWEQCLAVIWAFPRVCHGVHVHSSTDPSVTFSIWTITPELWQHFPGQMASASASSKTSQNPHLFKKAFPKWVSFKAWPLSFLQLIKCRRDSPAPPKAGMSGCLISKHSWYGSNTVRRDDELVRLIAINVLNTPCLSEFARKR